MNLSVTWYGGVMMKSAAASRLRYSLSLSAPAISIGVDQ
jgi:hypothetical protein